MDSFSQPFSEILIPNWWVWCLGTETVSASRSKVFGDLDGIGINDPALTVVLSRFQHKWWRRICVSHGTKYIQHVLGHDLSMQELAAGNRFYGMLNYSFSSVIISKSQSEEYISVMNGELRNQASIPQQHFSALYLDC